MSETEIRNAIFKIFTVQPLKQREMGMYVPLDTLRAGRRQNNEVAGGYLFSIGSLEFSEMRER